MPREPDPTWKRVVAFVLDFLLVFLAGGYLIAILTGDATADGFRLTGWPAVALLALILVYFFGMNRLAGGTIFRRVFGIPPRRG